MAVKTIEHRPRVGAVKLGPTDYLIYTFTPEAPANRNAIFTFACKHRTMIDKADATSPAFNWYLGAVPLAGSPHEENHFPLDAPVSTEDVYVLGMKFFQCPQYRLQIVQHSTGLWIRDESYIAQSTADTWSDSLFVFLWPEEA